MALSNANASLKPKIDIRDVRNREAFLGKRNFDHSHREPNTDIERRQKTAPHLTNERVVYTSRPRAPSNGHGQSSSKHTSKHPRSNESQNGKYLPEHRAHPYNRNTSSHRSRNASTSSNSNSSSSSALSVSPTYRFVSYYYGNETPRTEHGVSQNATQQLSSANTNRQSTFTSDHLRRSTSTESSQTSSHVATTPKFTGNKAPGHSATSSSSRVLMNTKFQQVSGLVQPSASAAKTITSHNYRHGSLQSDASRHSHVQSPSKTICQTDSRHFNPSSNGVHRTVEKQTGQNSRESFKNSHLSSFKIFKTKNAVPTPTKPNSDPSFKPKSSALFRNSSDSGFLQPDIIKQPIEHVRNLPQVVTATESFDPNHWDPLMHGLSLLNGITKTLIDTVRNESPIDTMSTANVQPSRVNSTETASTQIEPVMNTIHEQRINRNKFDDFIGQNVQPRYFNGGLLSKVKPARTAAKSSQPVTRPEPAQPALAAKSQPVTRPEPAQPALAAKSQPVTRPEPAQPALAAKSQLVIRSESSQRPAVFHSHSTTFAKSGNESKPNAVNGQHPKDMRPSGSVTKTTHKQADVLISANSNLTISKSANYGLKRDKSSEIYRHETILNKKLAQSTNHQQTTEPTTINRVKQAQTTNSFNQKAYLCNSLHKNRPKSPLLTTTITLAEHQNSSSILSPNKSKTKQNQQSDQTPTKRVRFSIPESNDDQHLKRSEHHEKRRSESQAKRPVGQPDHHSNEVHNHFDRSSQLNQSNQKSNWQIGNGLSAFHRPLKQLHQSETSAFSRPQKHVHHQPETSATVNSPHKQVSQLETSSSLNQSPTKLIDPCKTSPMKSSPPKLFKLAKKDALEISLHHQTKIISERSVSLGQPLAETRHSSSELDSTRSQPIQGASTKTSSQHKSVHVGSRVNQNSSTSEKSHKRSQSNELLPQKLKHKAKSLNDDQRQPSPSNNRSTHEDCSGSGTQKKSVSKYRKWFLQGKFNQKPENLTQDSSDSEAEPSSAPNSKRTCKTFQPHEIQKRNSDEKSCHLPCPLNSIPKGFSCKPSTSRQIFSPKESVHLKPSTSRQEVICLSDSESSDSEPSTLETAVQTAKEILKLLKKYERAKAKNPNTPEPVFPPIRTNDTVELYSCLYCAKNLARQFLPSKQSHSEQEVKPVRPPNGHRDYERRHFRREDFKEGFENLKSLENGMVMYQFWLKHLEKILKKRLRKEAKARRRMGLPPLVSEVVEDSADHHDNSCWACHKEVKAYDKVKRCTSCQLVWHQKVGCLKEAFKTPPYLPERSEQVLEHHILFPIESNPDMCTECKMLEYAYQYARLFGILSPGYNKQTVAKVFEYAINAFSIMNSKTVHTSSHCFWKIDHSTKPVYRKMDLQTMWRKRMTYQTTHQVVFDYKLMIHNLKSSNSYDTFWKDRIKQFQVEFDKEIDFIDRCENCYLKYYEETDPRSDDGNNVPCDTPHEIVWFWCEQRWWPAKVFEYRKRGTFAVDTDLFAVIRFGVDNRRASIVSTKVLRMFSKNPPPPLPANPRETVLENVDKLWKISKNHFEIYRQNLNLYYDYPNFAKSAKFFHYRRLYSHSYLPKNPVQSAKNGLEALKLSPEICIWGSKGFR